VLVQGAATGVRGMKTPSKKKLMQVFRFWSGRGRDGTLRPSSVLSKHQDWVDTAWDNAEFWCPWQKMADVAASCALSDAMLPARWAK